MPPVSPRCWTACCTTPRSLAWMAKVTAFEKANWKLWRGGKVMNEPARDREVQPYVRTILGLYQKLPETPTRPSSRDCLCAYQLQQRGVPLALIESAFLIGSLRRLLRPPGAPPLPPIRSLAYFQPVIEELLHTPIPDTYVEFLRHKMQSFAGKKISRRESLMTTIRKTTDSDDR